MAAAKNVNISVADEQRLQDGFQPTCFSLHVVDSVSDNYNCFFNYAFDADF